MDSVSLKRPIEVSFKSWAWSLPCFFAITTSAYAHEYTGFGTIDTKAAEMHALYHKAKASYRFIDALTINEPILNRVSVHSFYFDPEKDTLYTCLGNDENSILCYDATKKAPTFSWSSAELSYGQRNSLTPIDRYFVGPVYFLEGVNPFSQITTYVYYSGRAKLVKCRKTLTTYTFEARRKGETLFFQSEKKDDFSERCEQLYPRP